MSKNIEIWTGIEATVNRVGDIYHDQLEISGHATRTHDLELLPELGITAIRYPILWERLAPHGIDSIDWSWADERLAKLRSLGIHPIVGLTHHGSGPLDTHLLDPNYPGKLAAYARLVAQRYPWITDYTPVNEPLTTARFSALYGHWYPHKKDDKSFLTALLTQIDGIKEAMKAIRKVNPLARLIQTEDLGKTHSTPDLAYQASFENERRFLSYDLLCGQFHPSQYMNGYIQSAGIPRERFDTYNSDPIVPDVMGINYYITGQRFLDNRISLYPESMHGGNHKERYVDIETVRIALEGVEDLASLLKEVTDRYKLPIAITEVHLGCTREEQMRWLAEVWNALNAAQKNGITVTAMTPWALIGSYDWDSLVTKRNGHYEPGIFDLRSSTPRPTALARMIGSLAKTGTYDHPVLDTNGWWHREDRFRHSPLSRLQNNDMHAMSPPPQLSRKKQKLLIIGATGTLGKACARICEIRGLTYDILSRPDIDITDSSSVQKVLKERNPWAVINAAGYVKVDDAEVEQELCRQINAIGPLNLAQVCAELKIHFVTFSSDLVFDGGVVKPYKETDTLSPLNVYGKSKADAEKYIKKHMPEALIIRTGGFFGPWDQYNFLTNAIQTIQQGINFQAANDYTVSPTYIPDLVNAFLDLLIDGEYGTWHIANAGAVTWEDFARQSLTMYHLDESLIEGKPMQSFNLPAQRPMYSVLGSERGELLPSLEDALYRYGKASNLL